MQLPPRKRAFRQLIKPLENRNADLADLAVCMERSQMRRTGDFYPKAPDTVEAAWYCVQAQHKHEHIAAAHLSEVRGVTVFCPRIRIKRLTRTRVAWVTEALFPGYLFAHFELAQLHRVVSYTPGVRYIVRFANRYPTIDDATLAQLREHVGPKEIKEMDYQPSKGDTVKIAEGSLAGLEAVITEILPARARVRVLMDFLGRKMEMDVEHSAILRWESDKEGLG
jgi:transcriptional antiterminator RfaH